MSFLRLLDESSSSYDDGKEAGKVWFCWDIDEDNRLHISFDIDGPTPLGELIPKWRDHVERAGLDSNVAFEFQEQFLDISLTRYETTRNLHEDDVIHAFYQQVGVKGEAKIMDPSNVFASGLLPKGGNKPDQDDDWGVTKHTSNNKLRCNDDDDEHGVSSNVSSSTSTRSRASSVVHRTNGGSITTTSATKTTTRLFQQATSQSNSNLNVDRHPFPMNIAGVDASAASNSLSVTTTSKESGPSSNAKPIPPNSSASTKSDVTSSRNKTASHLSTVITNKKDAATLDFTNKSVPSTSVKTKGPAKKARDGAKTSAAEEATTSTPIRKRSLQSSSNSGKKIRKTSQAKPPPRTTDECASEQEDDSSGNSFVRATKEVIQQRRILKSKEGRATRTKSMPATTAAAATKASAPTSEMDDSQKASAAHALSANGGRMIVQGAWRDSVATATSTQANSLESQVTLQPHSVKKSNKDKSRPFTAIQEAGQSPPSKKLYRDTAPPRPQSLASRCVEAGSSVTPMVVDSVHPESGQVSERMEHTASVSGPPSSSNHKQSSTSIFNNENPGISQPRAGGSSSARFYATGKENVANKAPEPVTKAPTHFRSKPEEDDSAPTSFAKQDMMPLSRPDDAEKQKVTNDSPHGPKSNKQELPGSSRESSEDGSQPSKMTKTQFVVKVSEESKTSTTTGEREWSANKEGQDGNGFKQEMVSKRAPEYVKKFGAAPYQRTSEADTSIPISSAAGNKGSPAPPDIQQPSTNPTDAARVPPSKPTRTSLTRSASSNKPCEAIAAAKFVTAIAASSCAKKPSNDEEDGGAKSRNVPVKSPNTTAKTNDSEEIKSSTTSKKATTENEDAQKTDAADDNIGFPSNDDASLTDNDDDTLGSAPDAAAMTTEGGTTRDATRNHLSSLQQDQQDKKVAAKEHESNPASPAKGNSDGTPDHGEKLNNPTPIQQPVDGTSYELTNSTGNIIGDATKRVTSEAQQNSATSKRLSSLTGTSTKTLVCDECDQEKELGKFSNRQIEFAVDGCYFRCVLCAKGNIGPGAIEKNWKNHNDKWSLDTFRQNMAKEAVPEKTLDPNGKLQETLSHRRKKFFKDKAAGKVPSHKTHGHYSRADSQHRDMIVPGFVRRVRQELDENGKWTGRWIVQYYRVSVKDDGTEEFTLTEHVVTDAFLKNHLTDVAYVDLILKAIQMDEVKNRNEAWVNLDEVSYFSTYIDMSFFIDIAAAPDEGYILAMTAKKVELLYGRTKAFFETMEGPQGQPLPDDLEDTINEHFNEKEPSFLDLIPGGAAGSGKDGDYDFLEDHEGNPKPTAFQQDKYTCLIDSMLNVLVLAGYDKDELKKLRDELVKIKITDFKGKEYENEVCHAVGSALGLCFDKIHDCDWKTICKDYPLVVRLKGANKHYAGIFGGAVDKCDILVEPSMDYQLKLTWGNLELIHNEDFKEELKGKFAYAIRIWSESERSEYISSLSDRQSTVCIPQDSEARKKWSMEEKYECPVCKQKELFSKRRHGLLMKENPGPEAKCIPCVEKEVEGKKAKEKKAKQNRKKKAAKKRNKGKKA